LTPAFLDRSGRWFLDSGIQDGEGGVARYRRDDTGENLPVSAEITGYTASALVYLYKLTNEGAYFERALQTAAYLTRIWDTRLEAFPFEPDPSRDQLNYFFDAGIIIRGLLTVWRETGDARLLEVALGCGLGMLRDFDCGAEFHPILTLPQKLPLARDGRWSRNPGCYQLKAAMSWFDLAEATRNETLRAAYERALAYSLSAHPAFLPGDAEQPRVMDRLHAFCYFLEGLLPVLDRKACAAALCIGIVRTGSYLREIAPCFERSDVHAQLLRVRLLADLAGIVPLDETAAAFEAESLARYLRPDGGFWFGSAAGEHLPFVNPVSTAFGLQALCMWQEYRSGSLPSRPFDEHRSLLI
jgi:hypothetical protein